MGAGGPRERVRCPPPPSPCLPWALSPCCASPCLPWASCPALVPLGFSASPAPLLACLALLRAALLACSCVALLSPSPCSPSPFPLVPLAPFPLAPFPLAPLSSCASCPASPASLSPCASRSASPVCAACGSPGVVALCGRLRGWRVVLVPCGSGGRERARGGNLGTARGTREAGALPSGRRTTRSRVAACPGASHPGDSAAVPQVPGRRFRWGAFRWSDGSGSWAPAL
jgi:hypothetical protein